MTISYKIDNDKCLMIWWIADKVDPQEYAELSLALSRSPDFRPRYQVLVIFEEGVNLMLLNQDGIRRIQDATLDNLGRGTPEHEARTVFLCPDKMTETIAALYQEMRVARTVIGADIQVCQRVSEAAQILDVDLSDVDMPSYALAS